MLTSFCKVMSKKGKVRLCQSWWIQVKVGEVRATKVRAKLRKVGAQIGSVGATVSKR